MSETVLYWGKIEVSKDDAALLDQDVLLYGNAYVEVFEKGRARRIPPSHVRETTQVHLPGVRIWHTGEEQ